MCIFALRTYLKDPWTRNAKDTTALSGGFFILESEGYLLGFVGHNGFY